MSSELFLKKLNQIYGAKTQSVIAGLSVDRPTTCRVNFLKSSFEDVALSLKSDGYDLLPCAELAGAYILQSTSDAKPIAQTESFLNGWIYLQSLSSQLPVVILNPKSNQKILDLCAAPGGKTSQLASLTKAPQNIVAVESDPIRYEKLKSNLKKQGAQAVTTILSSGEKLGREHESQYDAVLLDAPCSSEGTFDLRDQTSFKHWSPEFVSRQAHLQKQLLEYATRYLKKGGTLVYSTCALSPEENEAVVSHAVDSGLPLKIERLKLENFKPNGLTKFGKHFFHADVAHTLRIAPDNLWEGFFVAKFKRL